MEQLLSTLPPSDDPTEDRWMHKSRPMTARGKAIFENLTSSTIPDMVNNNLAFNTKIPIEDRIERCSLRLFLRVRDAPKELVAELIHKYRKKQAHSYVGGNFDPDEFNVPYSEYNEDSRARFFPFNAAIDGHCICRDDVTELNEDFNPSTVYEFRVPIKNPAMYRLAGKRLPYLGRFEPMDLVAELLDCEINHTLFA